MAEESAFKISNNIMDIFIGFSIVWIGYFAWAFLLGYIQTLPFIKESASIQTINIIGFSIYLLILVILIFVSFFINHIYIGIGIILAIIIPLLFYGACGGKSLIDTIINLNNNLS